MNNIKENQTYGWLWSLDLTHHPPKISSKLPRKSSKSSVHTGLPVNQPRPPSWAVLLPKAGVNMCRFFYHETSGLETYFLQRWNFGYPWVIIPYPTFCGTQVLLWIAGDPGIPTCTRHGRNPFKSWRDKGNFLLSTFNNFENCWLHDLHLHPHPNLLPFILSTNECPKMQRFTAVAFFQFHTQLQQLPLPLAGQRALASLQLLGVQPTSKVARDLPRRVGRDTVGLNKKGALEHMAFLKEAIELYAWSQFQERTF